MPTRKTRHFRSIENVVTEHLKQNVMPFFLPAPQFVVDLFVIISVTL